MYSRDTGRDNSREGGGGFLLRVRTLFLCSRCAGARHARAREARSQRAERGGVGARGARHGARARNEVCEAIAAPA